MTAATTTGTTRRVFPLVNGVRAIALCAILLFHASGAGSPYPEPLSSILARLESLATPLFFIISGFLVYRPFVAARWEGRARPSLRRYATSRFLRIIPAYWFALTVMALTVTLPEVFSGSWWVHYLLLPVYLHWTGPTQGLGVAWSVAVEVSFCVALGLFVALPRRRPPRLATELLILAVAAALSLTVQGWYLASEGTLGHLNITLPALLYMFLIGMALATWSVAREQRSRPRPGLVTRWPLLCCWVPAAVIYAWVCLGLGVPAPGSAIQAFSQPVWISAQLLPAVAAALLLVPAIVDESRSRPAVLVLGSPLLSGLGAIAYGMYLWHSIPQGYLRAHGVFSGPSYTDLVLFFVVTTLATVPLALASFILVERPLLSLVAPRGTRPAAADRRDRSDDRSEHGDDEDDSTRSPGGWVTWQRRGRRRLAGDDDDAPPSWGGGRRQADSPAAGAADVEGAHLRAEQDVTGPHPGGLQVRGG